MFDFVPTIVVVGGSNYTLVLVKDCTTAVVCGKSGDTQAIVVSWSGTTVKYYNNDLAIYQINEKSTTYNHAAVG